MNQAKIYAIEQAPGILHNFAAAMSEQKETKNFFVGEFFAKVLSEKRMEITARIQSALVYWMIADSQEQSDLDLKISSLNTAWVYLDLPKKQSHVLRKMTEDMADSAQEFLFDNNNKITQMRNKFYHFGRNSYREINTVEELGEYLEETLSAFGEVGGSNIEKNDYSNPLESLLKLLPENENMQKIKELMASESWQCEKIGKLARDVWIQLDSQDELNRLNKKRFNPELAPDEYASIQKAVLAGVSSYIQNTLDVADQLIAGTEIDLAIANKEEVVRTQTPKPLKLR